jgi:hypothetical protein
MIGIVCLGFSISLQVPIFVSWANLAFIAFSHSSYSTDLLASFKVGSSLFAVTEKISSQTAAAVLTISSSSSLLEKGSCR